jgi:hypothetical protein
MDDVKVVIRFGGDHYRRGRSVRFVRGTDDSGKAQGDHQLMQTHRPTARDHGGLPTVAGASRDLRDRRRAPTASIEASAFERRPVTR